MNRTLKSLFVSLAVLLAGLAAIGLLMFAFVQNAEAHGAGARAVGSKLEVAISDGGRTVVRGAEVTDISGDVIRARTEWGQSSLTWNIETDSNTDFVVKDGSGSDIDDISVGDYVSFSGMLNESASTFTVDADVVKNWSEPGKSAEAHERNEARAEARAEVKARWGDWMRGMPILKWFNGDKDR